ncbi:hypothetical protein BC831DRAFT_259279 [Entophlyctis helioformis]|nr:hypothetical protein BC831DRAFT_259279 [Entophlyctis helioformis]
MRSSTVLLPDLLLLPLDCQCVCPNDDRIWHRCSPQRPASPFVHQRVNGQLSTTTQTTTTATTTTTAMSFVLPSAFVGTLTGMLLACASVDSLWWPHLVSSYADPSSLKSRVPAQARTDSVAFYRLVASLPPNVLYVLLALTAMTLITFVGGIVQHPHKRLRNAACLLTVGAAVALEALVAVPDIRAVTGKGYKRADVQTEALFHIALCHAGVLALLTVTLFVLAAGEEADEARGEKEAAAAARARAAKRAAKAAAAGGGGKAASKEDKPKTE